MGKNRDPLSTNRRKVLLAIGAVGGMTAVYGTYHLTRSQVQPDAAGLEATTLPARRATTGYGSDPDMLNPEITWNKILTAKQLAMITVLSDIIIPSDDKSPSASALDIPDFVNEWVSAPYPIQEEDYKTILSGLQWLNQEAGKLGAQSYVELPENTQTSLFERLAQAIKSGSAPEMQKKFFERLIYIITGGYYTTPEGMKDIGYIGNVPMATFDGPSEEIKRKLGV